ncbi:hypothetical protein F66182_3490 [Fusarium sp. NRRL 66182]|nr:hypothetical protein F66182_3490 [Fusarium sp. NRRL 66182]
MRPNVIQRVFLSLFIADFCAALISDEGREYCTGGGSICEAYYKIDRTCRDETGRDYYKCTCKTGWVPLQKACYDCRRAMGDLMLDSDEMNRENCKDDDFEIASIPSSIISQQKEHNKTATVPTMEATMSATRSPDSSFMTRSHEPHTSTLYGAEASVTLPEIPDPTVQSQDEDNGAMLRAGGGFAAVAFDIDTRPIANYDFKQSASGLHDKTLFLTRQAAAFAALSVEFVVHPFDTLITRIQSPEYIPKYRSLEGKLQPALFRGLYRGLTPTVITTIPASVTFFTIYEKAKSALQPSEGFKPGSLSQTAVHAASSALADMVACAIINPSEVLKQNAQVSRFSEGQGQRFPVLAALKHFSRQPLKLWTGYTVLVAGNLPRTSLTFSIYEYLKGSWLQRSKNAKSIKEQVRVSACTAGVGGALASLLFVPVDVVKTRMRLPEKAPPSHHLQPEALFSASLSREKARQPSARGPISIAKGILLRDGVSGLFRGATVTCVAAAVGNGLFLGCYEGLKLYYANEGPKKEITTP